MSSEDQLWEQNATWWQEGFTDGEDPEYEEQILPIVENILAESTRVIDIGCGEGQLTRLLERLGSQPVGLDPTWAQIREANSRNKSSNLVQAGAGYLPFVDGCFDAALACLVFEHIEDLETSMKEVARVLRPDGRFALLLNHPLLQTPGSGWVEDYEQDSVERYWRIGPYLMEQETIEEVEKGVFIPFVHRPLSRYVNTLIENGLFLERMIEPTPPEGFRSKNPSYQAASHIPRLLVLVTRKINT
jgi:SAM-dependent methyltransferase